MNTLHNWFLPKQRPQPGKHMHASRSQEQHYTEETRTMREDDDNPHIAQMQIYEHGDHEWD